MWLKLPLSWLWVPMPILNHSKLSSVAINTVTWLTDRSTRDPQTKINQCLSISWELILEQIWIGVWTSSFHSTHQSKLKTRNSPKLSPTTWLMASQHPCSLERSWWVLRRLSLMSFMTQVVTGWSSQILIASAVKDLSMTLQEQHRSIPKHHRELMDPLTSRARPTLILYASIAYHRLVPLILSTLLSTIKLVSPNLLRVFWVCAWDIRWSYRPRKLKLDLFSPKNSKRLAKSQLMSSLSLWTVWIQMAPTSTLAHLKVKESKVACSHWSICLSTKTFSGQCHGKELHSTVLKMDTVLKAPTQSLTRVPPISSYLHQCLSHS